MGLALVTSRYLPVAVGGAFWDDGHCFAFCYLGVGAKWFKQRPTRILRAARKLITALQDVGVDDMYMEADERIPKSAEFIEWWGGKATGKRASNGPLYHIKLSEVEKI